MREPPCVERTTDGFTLFLCPYVWSFLYKTAGLKTSQSEFSQQVNSLNSCCGLVSKTPPIPNYAQNGQSVENALAETLHDNTLLYIKREKEESLVRWYAARVTYGRARAVYEALANLNEDAGITPYLPVTKKQVCRIVDGKPFIEVEEKPVHAGLLFVRSSYRNYRKLVRESHTIPGFTPFYDHFSISSTGRNNYLAVPDRQFDSFRYIIESGHEDILIDQEQMPSYLSGKRVRVIGGVFEGVEGTLLKWKHQRRVFVDLGQFGKYGTGYIRTCDFEIIND